MTFSDVQTGISPFSYQPSQVQNNTLDTTLLCRAFLTAQAPDCFCLVAIATTTVVCLYCKFGVVTLHHSRTTVHSIFKSVFLEILNQVTNIMIGV